MNEIHEIDELNTDHIMYLDQLLQKRQSVDIRFSKKDKDDKDDKNEKKIISYLAEFARSRSFFCHQYLQSNFIEFRTNQHPFKSIKYYL